MRSYLSSKPPSQLDPSWFTWTLENFINIDPEFNKTAALLYFTWKREIGIIYKPTPVKGPLTGSLVTCSAKKCTPAFFKINGDKVGSCYAIQNHKEIPSEHWPDMLLQANILKGTNYKYYPHEISMWVIPNLSPLPFGGKIKQTLFNNAFIEEMATISKHHGMWAKLMSEVINQAVTNKSNVPTIAKRLLNLSGTRNRDPCCAASKGFKSATIPTSAPFVEISTLCQTFPKQQATLCSYFEHNPTPACAEELPADVLHEDAPRVQVVSTAATDVAANVPDQEFYKVMIETMKNLQKGAPIQNQKIIVESRDHEETVNAAKLQMSMVRLMYATTTTVNWWRELLSQFTLAPSPKSTRASWSTPPLYKSPSLQILPRPFSPLNPKTTKTIAHSTGVCCSTFSSKKIIKGHLNTTFQSDDLKLAAMHESMSINPFHYEPQNDQALVILARKEQEEERNEKNFSIIETHIKKVSSLIMGIGKINTMEDVAMTCANMCGMQLAIINVASNKPLLYQYAWRMICFIKNKKFTCWHACNAQLLAHLPMLFMGKLHQFFQNLALFSQNSVNTNLVEHGATGDNLDIKNITIAVKFAAKFWKK
jgi:hypothetical protein